METAINIGYACSLLTNDQKRLMITSETPLIVEAEQRDGADLPTVIEAEVRGRIGDAVKSDPGPVLLCRSGYKAMKWSIWRESIRC